MAVGYRNKERTPKASGNISGASIKENNVDANWKARQIAGSWDTGGTRNFSVVSLGWTQGGMWFSRGIWE